MSPGYQATQALHAAVELALLPKATPHLRQWEAVSGVVVNLTCSDKWELLDLAEEFQGECYWTMFYEPDVKSYTSIAALLTPELAKRVSHLPLLLKGGE